MFGAVLWCCALLGQAGADPSPKEERADAKAAQEPRKEAAEAAALAEYNARKAKVARTAEAQWRLALWCEEKGLKAEARVHLSEVVKLDPKRSAAWKKLGFQQIRGRWLSEDQIREAAEQKKADEIWGPRLKNIHKNIHGGKRQAEAEAELASIDDPRAVPSVYREFAGRGAADQSLAVQVLGQTRSQIASKTLAILSIYGLSPGVRQNAVETLRGRDPAEYTDLLIGLLTDPLKYEVRPVGGPGSPGVLFIEGERFNVRRFYAPPAAPNVSFQPGDEISYDATGMPVIKRAGGSTMIGRSNEELDPTHVKRTDTFVNRRTVISPGQLAAEAYKGALTAQAQLQNDVAMVEATNDARKAFNRIVSDVLKSATGTDSGETRSEWSKWFAGLNGSRTQQDDERVKPTIDEMVPLAYNPRFGPIGVSMDFVKEVHIIEDT